MSLPFEPRSLWMPRACHARPQRKLFVPGTQLRSFRSPGTVTEAKVKVFKGATDSSGSDVGIEWRYIGVENVKGLADPIKLSIHPSAPAIAFRPEGFLAADDGAIHDVCAKQFQLEYLSAGGGLTLSMLRGRVLHRQNCGSAVATTQECNWFMTASLGSDLQIEPMNLECPSEAI